MKLLDGTAVAKEIQNIIAKAIAPLERKPGLAFVLVGDNPASQTYIRMKKRKCEEVGIVSFDCVLPKTATEAQVLKEIEKYNRNPHVDGILVQLPLPDQINAMNVM